MIGMTWPQWKRHACSVDGQEVHLSPAPARILLLLLLRYPGPATRDELIEWLWPDPNNEPQYPENILSVVMATLRKRIGAEHLSCTRYCGWRVVQKERAPEEALSGN